MNWDEYEHLKCVIILCTVHYKRNIHALGKDVSKEVKQLMFDLATCEELRNIEEILSKIRESGKAAASESQCEFCYRWQAGSVS